MLVCSAPWWSTVVPVPGTPVISAGLVEHCSTCTRDTPVISAGLVEHCSTCTRDTPVISAGLVEHCSTCTRDTPVISAGLICLNFGFSSLQDFFLPGDGRRATCSSVTGETVCQMPRKSPKATEKKTQFGLGWSSSAAGSRKRRHICTANKAPSLDRWDYMVYGLNVYCGLPRHQHNSKTQAVLFSRDLILNLQQGEHMTAG